MASDVPFSRRTILAAIGVLAPGTHAGFEALRVHFGLEDTDAGTGPYISSRSASLAAFCVKQPTFETPYGPIAVAVVHAACETLGPRIDYLDIQTYQGQEFNVPPEVELIRSLHRDGFTLNTSGLHRALPEQMDVPAADDEVHDLLEKFGFRRPRATWTRP